MSNALSQLPENFQQCRENRHPWSDYNVIEQGTQLEQIQICPRCGNQRSRILSTSKRSYGHIVRKWQIKYVEKEYLLKLESPLTADDWGEMRMGLLAEYRRRKSGSRK